MNNLSQVFDFQKFQQNSKLEAITRNVESRYEKAALSDDDLDMVSAAGDISVPALHPDVLLGKHILPEDDQERKP